MVGRVGVDSERGHAQRHFQPKVDYPVGDSPRSVAVGDFNRDGKRDLAVANSNDFNVSILKGKTDGTFKPKVDYDVADRPVSIAIGDFDRDHRQDLATVGGFFGNVSILIND